MTSLKTVVRWCVALVIAYVVLLGVGRISETDRGPLILAAGGVLVAIGWVVHRLTRTGPRLRRSGREPRDVGPIDTMAFPEHRDDGP
jgi:hypothetical protein